MPKSSNGRKKVAGRQALAADAIAALSKIPGLGPRRAEILYSRLGISSLVELHKALLNGRINEAVGFSEHMATRLLGAVTQLVQPKGTQRPAG